MPIPAHDITLNVDASVCRLLDIAARGPSRMRYVLDRRGITTASLSPAVLLMPVSPRQSRRQKRPAAAADPLTVRP